MKFDSSRVLEDGAHRRVVSLLERCGSFNIPSLGGGDLGSVRSSMRPSSRARVATVSDVSSRAVSTITESSLRAWKVLYVQGLSFIVCVCESVCVCVSLCVCVSITLLASK